MTPRKISGCLLVGAAVFLAGLGVGDATHYHASAPAVLEGLADFGGWIVALLVVGGVLVREPRAAGAVA